MRPDLPSGTVTFLFTDVDGSTRLLHELGAAAYAEALAEHRQVLRETCAAQGGVEVDTQGDAFFFAFPAAPDALTAARKMTEALATGQLRVRVGVHTGTPLLTEEGYVGEDVHRAARIAAAGHGGQVLVSRSTAALVGVELRDLGEHRLKDLSAPERIYQLGDGGFPALKSLYRTNLPIPTTPFLGREHELAEVVGLLDSTRLLTLTGPGGTGKTRLAAQAAGLASQGYPDGVWWIPLALLRDFTLVLETAAQFVGSENGLAEHIADKSMLCLFDNFEQVVEAAPELAALLSSCPNLHVLVTSRERLRVTGEQEYPVPPLVHEEGVGFFLARARAVKPDFVADGAVSEICARLDDLPLALELAAARVKALSSTQILERLEQRLPLLTGGARDLPERQRTLRATIAWSYELLSEEEQRLFARLAVFRGGCTLEAAEAVGAADLDALQSLVDKSLLRFTDERYWTLETIREYAAERLEASGETDELRRRHADYFLAFGKEAERHLRRQSREWLDRIEREHDNVRAALDWLEASGESGLVLELAAAVWWFWSLRGPPLEGRSRLERALEGDARPTATRANALMGAVDFAVDAGDYVGARVRAGEALDLQRRLGDTWGIAYTLLGLGLAYALDNDWLAAQPNFEESVRLFEELGDAHEAMESARRLAWSYEALGDLERSRELHENNVRRARATGDEFVEARSLSVLATFALEEGRVDEAIPMLEQAHRLHSEKPDLPDRYSHAILACRLARALVLRGDAATAARLLSCFEAQLEQLGVFEQWVTDMNDVTLALIRKDLDEAAAAEAWAKGQGLTVDEAVALAFTALARDA